MSKPEMKTYEIPGKYGINDIKSLCAWWGGWGQGDMHGDSDVNGDHRFMSFQFGEDIDQTDQKAIDAEIKRREQQNIEYIEDLKELGAYGTEYITSFTLAHNPLLDDPKRVKPDTKSYRYTILDLSKVPEKKPLVFKEYEVWMGNCGSMGQGDHGPTEPRMLGKVKATSFNIACVIYEHQSAIDHLNLRMNRGDTHIEDIHFGGWCYTPKDNRNSWTGKYYESEQEALKSFK
jgi:hypothetical protein